MAIDLVSCARPFFWLSISVLLEKPIFSLKCAKVVIKLIWPKKNGKIVFLESVHM